MKFAPTIAFRAASWGYHNMRREKMLQIDYKITNRFKKPTDEDLAVADDTDFSYYLFTGDIIFTNSQADFSTHWGWVPIMDFIVCLNAIVEDLKDGASGLFEFTESEATINFERSGDIVRVSSSYADGVIEVPYGQIVEVSSDALVRLRNQLITEYPVLLDNDAFNGMMTSPKDKRTSEQ